MKFCFHNTFLPNPKYTNNGKRMVGQVYREIGGDNDDSDSTQTGHMYSSPMWQTSASESFVT